MRMKSIHTRINFSCAHEILIRGWQFHTEMKFIFRRSWIFGKVDFVLKRDAKCFKSRKRTRGLHTKCEDDLSENSDPTDLCGTISFQLTSCFVIWGYFNYKAAFEAQYINVSAADDNAYYQQQFLYILLWGRSYGVFWWRVRCSLIFKVITFLIIRKI